MRKKKKTSSAGTFQKRISRDKSVASNKRQQKAVETRLKALKRKAALLRKKAARKIKKK